MSYSTAWLSSRRRARYNDGTDPTPANVRPPGATIETHLSTRRHVAWNLHLIWECVGPIRDACVVLDTRMRGRDDRGRKPTTGTTLIVVDATMPTRTEA
jgi:hypothetical protein